MMSIGKKILALRRKLDLSQEQMAQELHVSRQTISKWESDLSLPDMKTVLLMSELYDVSVAELLGVEDSKDDSITQLYNQLHLVNKNLESAKKRRTIFDIVLIGICIACLSLTTVILLKRNNTNVVQNYYENPTEYNESDHLVLNSEKNILSYDFNKGVMNVEMIYDLKQDYKDAKVESIMIDEQGKSYSYLLKKSDVQSRYIYKGEIPLKDYQREKNILTSKDVILSDVLEGTSYMNSVLNDFIHLKIVGKEGSTGRQLQYSFSHEWSEIKHKGKLQGTMHIIINVSSKNENYNYFDKTNSLGNDQSFDVKELKRFDDLYVECTLVIDDTEYTLSDTIKIVDAQPHGNYMDTPLL